MIDLKIKIYNFLILNSEHKNKNWTFLTFKPKFWSFFNLKTEKFWPENQKQNFDHKKKPNNWPYNQNL